jgi:hypothetical protein
VGLLFVCIATSAVAVSRLLHRNPTLSLKISEDHNVILRRFCPSYGLQGYQNARSITVGRRDIIISLDSYSSAYTMRP